MDIIGESGYCYVHQVSGTLVHDYRHPGPVYGCDWRDADILATGCEDGKIRIFNVSKNRKEPVSELKGIYLFLFCSISIFDRQITSCLFTLPKYC